jgi:hypothetical protein
VHSIVLLYNDRDRPTVEAIGCALEELWKNFGVSVWIANKHLTGFGDLFQQVEGAIQEASGVVVFLGSHGLGRFQENIELGAVNTEIWQRGARFGRLLVHLASGLEVPRALLRWPTVNHDGVLQGVPAITAGIFQRFGFAGGQ